MIASTGRIWEAASKDESRPVLTGVWFDAEKATLTATNSYIAARVPCEVDEGDESGLIPAEAVRIAASGKVCRGLRVADGKATLQLPDGERIWTLLPGVFPSMDKIFEQAKPAVRFGLNARLLHDLARALGCGADYPVVIHPTHPLKSILANGPRDDNCVGVLMPVRVERESGQILTPPDLSNDEAVVTAARAAISALDRRRGKARAAEAFRNALASATADKAA